MSRIEFADLLALYRNAEFGVGGEDDQSEVTVANAAIAGLLTRVDGDDYAAAETGVTVLGDLDALEIGAVVRARLDNPRSGFAVLARDPGGLIRSPGARMEEPARFYLAAPAYAPGDAHVPDVVARYRKVLAVVGLFGQAASLVDATKSELVFVRDGRTVLPIRFDETDLSALDEAAADRLLAMFADDLHRDQKCSILFEALVDLCRAGGSEGRFRLALRGLGDLADRVADGYRLFASSFSYGKIKGELEDARIDYTQKIHKTIVDIQNQLLGIPVATIVVASQMKAPTACGPELWVNRAVLVGAWIFVLMLLVAIINQWLTLNVIGDEIERQRSTLQRDFASVSADFVGTFTKLKRRIGVHKVGLGVVFAIGIVGGLTATFFDKRISTLTPLPCPAAGGYGAGGEVRGAAAALAAHPTVPGDGPVDDAMAKFAKRPSPGAGAPAGAATPVPPDVDAATRRGQ